MERTLLVTGFGAFEGVEENPSGRLALALHAPPACVGVELPVTFRGAPLALDAALASLEGPPLAILSLGVHPGPSFRLERQATTALRPGRIDNEGVTGDSLGLVGAPLQTALDLEALDAVLRAAGAGEPELSSDAGGYVCERTYRHGLERGMELEVPALFLHVPPAEVLPVASQLPIVARLASEVARQARALLS
jgi:pyrrolidone-carboxylate peptidase